MEKLMIFGLAAWLGLLMSISPQPVKLPPRPAPINGQNDIETVAKYDPGVVYDNSNAKPVMVPVMDITYMSPE